MKFKLVEEIDRLCTDERGLQYWLVARTKVSSKPNIVNWFYANATKPGLIICAGKDIDIMDYDLWDDEEDFNSFYDCGLDYNEDTNQIYIKKGSTIKLLRQDPSRVFVNGKKHSPYLRGIKLPEGSELELRDYGADGYDLNNVELDNIKEIDESVIKNYEFNKKNGTFVSKLNDLTPKEKSYIVDILKKYFKLDEETEITDDTKLITYIDANTGEVTVFNIIFPEGTPNYTSKLRTKRDIYQKAALDTLPKWSANNNAWFIGDTVLKELNENGYLLDGINPLDFNMEPLDITNIIEEE